jgi:ABC-type transporter Mla MlaB component
LFFLAGKRLAPRQGCAYGALASGSHKTSDDFSWGHVLLRITRSEGSNQTRTLKLQGKLSGAWVSELESTCDNAATGAESVELDLGELTFVDGAGARFLSDLIQRGGRVVACSAFVAEMLHLERR